MQTNTKNIYAIGDIAGPPWLAHVASKEGILAAEHISGKKLSQLITRPSLRVHTALQRFPLLELLSSMLKKKGIRLKLENSPCLQVVKLWPYLKQKVLLK